MTNILNFKGIHNQNVYGTCPDANFPLEINGYCYYHSNGTVKDQQLATEYCEGLGGELGKIYDMSLAGIRAFASELPDGHGIYIVYM